jgi:hypothetical protein
MLESILTGSLATKFLKKWGRGDLFIDIRQYLKSPSDDLRGSRATPL